MTKISILNLREAAFCEGSREAPGRLCKKLLPRSFLQLARSRFFCIRFCFVVWSHFGPGARKYWPPTPQNMRGQDRTQNNYTKICTPPSGHPMVADETRQPPRLSPQLPSPKGGGTFSPPGHQILHSFVQLFIWRLPFFRPGAICFCSFSCANFVRRSLVSVFIHVFNGFATICRKRNRGPGSLFFAWWSNFGIGVTHFWKFPMHFLNILATKIARILLRFWQHWAPAAPWWDVRCPEGGV